MAKNKKKYYGVRQGRQVGVFESWEDCKRQTQGYSGAIYKSFASRQEAEDFVQANLRQDEPMSENKNWDTEEKILEKLKEGQMIAYVDGSYDVKKHAYGYGVVTFSSQGRKDYQGGSQEKDYANFRNVAGEVFASMEAMKIAGQAGMESLLIYHDYMGIRSWALGEWKRNNHLTKMYYDFYQSMKKHLEVEFIKVDAHTGDTFNEEADKLAKQAIK